jgi:hypothetical protein
MQLIQGKPVRATQDRVFLQVIPMVTTAAETDREIGFVLFTVGQSATGSLLSSRNDAPNVSLERGIELRYATVEEPLPVVKVSPRC